MYLFVCACMRVCVCVCVFMCEGECVGMHKDTCGWVIEVDIFVLCATCIAHNLNIGMHNCSCISTK